MIKDAFYFSHDSNARFDTKIIKLRAKFGLEGYGFYFCMLEIMRDNTDYVFNMDDIDTLTIQLQLSIEKIKELINFCVQIELFEIDNLNILFSDSFIKRMEEVDTLRLKRVKAGRKGGKAKAKLKQNSGKMEAVKESKVKESKIKEIKENIIKECDLEKFISYYNLKNDRKLYLTAQIRSEIRKGLQNENIETWLEVIDRSFNKGHFINDKFIPLSVLNLFKNYTSILDGTYNLIEEKKKVVINYD